MRNPDIVKERKKESRDIRKRKEKELEEKISEKRKNKI